MRLILSLGIIFFLSLFTVSTASYVQSAESWLGHSASALQNNWGMPDIKVRNASGNTLLVYHITTSRTYNRQWSPAVGVNVSQGRPVVVVTPPTNQNMSSTDLVLTCTVHFEVNKRGVIINVQKYGNGCD